MEDKLKVIGTPQRHCFATLPASIRDRILSQSTATSLSGSIVLKLKWSSPSDKTSFIGCRGDQTCDEGYIHIPTNILQCIHLSENILVSVTFVSSTTSYATTQSYDSVSLKPSSYEDWEIIQFNSEYVRDHLLEQIDVINDRDSFPLYIGDIKVHLQSNMRFRWGFVKLGRDTTIDIKPLKRSAKKTNSKKTMSQSNGINDRFADSISDIASHSVTSSNTNYIQHPSFYETKEIDSKSTKSSKYGVRADLKRSDEQIPTEEPLCSVFRIGSIDKYRDDIPSIPPNVIAVSPKILNLDHDENEEEQDIDRLIKGIDSKLQPPSLWDEFNEGDAVIVTFAVRQSFVHRNPNNDDQKQSEKTVHYKSVSMTLITCDYIENEDILLFSEYDLKCYGIGIGDFVVMEPRKLDLNTKLIPLVSSMDDSQSITVNLQQVMLVSSSTITSCSDLVAMDSNHSIKDSDSAHLGSSWSEPSCLYLDRSFKRELMHYIKSKVKRLCNHSIITMNDEADPERHFIVTLCSTTSHLQSEIDDEEMVGMVSLEKLSEKQLVIKPDTKCTALLNHDLLPPINGDLLYRMADHVLQQYRIRNCYPSHTLLYGNEVRIRLQYISRIIQTVHSKAEYPVAVVHVDCALFTNSRIRDVYRMLDDVMAESMELAPSLLILHDLDRLITFQKEPTAASMRAFQIGQKLLEHIDALNKFSAPSTRTEFDDESDYQQSVLIMASVVDPSSLDLTFLSSDIFHSVFCLNDSENDKSSKSKSKSSQNSVSSTTLHFNNNLNYLYSNLQHIQSDTDNALTFDALKSVVLNDCNQWFKYAAYHDIKHFVDQCVLEFISRSSTQSIEMPLFTDIIKDISTNFVPPSMRETFQSSSSAQDDEESWNDIGGLSTVKRELLDIFELPTKFAPIFDKLPLKLRTGVLLYGPPGCGKTMIAKAVAKRCGMNLISVKGPELLNKYIGASEAAVRDVFMRAKQSSPCIIFFDEFEALAPRRGSESTGVTDRVVNQLLTFLDGVESRSNVYVLAASSRPDLIDAALLRPGRLDKKLLCTLPDIEDRKDILKRIIMNKDIEIEEIKDGDEEALNELVEWMAKQSEYFSGADLNMIFTIAQTAAFHRCKERLMVEMKTEEDGDDEKREVIETVDGDDTQIEVKMTRDDLNEAIKQTAISVSASLQQQKQQGLTGTFKSDVDVHSVGKKSVQY